MEGLVRNDGVSVHYMFHEKEATGKCATLVNEGGERGMCADLLAANHYSKKDHFDTEPIQALICHAKATRAQAHAHSSRPSPTQAVCRTQVVYLSAFFITHSGGRETAVALGELAVSNWEHPSSLRASTSDSPSSSRAMGFRLCVNLGAGFILENDEYRRDLNSLLLCSDVVIGNESEAQIYATKEGWGEGLLHCAKDFASRKARKAWTPDNHHLRLL